MLRRSMLALSAAALASVAGLPDRRTGLCADLMAGSSAPTSCTNAYPNATEAARINSNYASFAALAAPGRLVLDAA